MNKPTLTLIALASSYTYEDMFMTFEVNGQQVTVTHADLLYWDLAAAAEELAQECVCYCNINGDWDDEEDIEQYGYEATMAHRFELIKSRIEYELEDHAEAEFEQAIAKKLAAPVMPSTQNVEHAAAYIELEPVAQDDQAKRDELRELAALCEAAGGVAVEATGHFATMFAFTNAAEGLQALLTDSRLKDVTQLQTSVREMMAEFSDLMAAKKQSA